MFVLFVLFVAGMTAGVAVWWVARWGHLDVGAPRVAPATVRQEVDGHDRLAGWLRRRTDPSVVTGSVLSAAVVLIVIGLGGVGVLLAMVREKRGFADFDLSAARFGAQHATALSTRTLRFVTQFGGAVVLVPLSAAVGVMEIRRQRTVAVAGFLTMAVGGSFLTSNLVKMFVDRARPDLSQLTGFSSSSFPSGHATAAAASFAAFALVAGRGRTRSTKAVLAGGAVGVAVLIGSSRILLGVHWLTDVLAGLCLGWGWFALCSLAFGGRLLRFGEPVAVAEREAIAEEEAGRPAPSSQPV